MRVAIVPARGGSVRIPRKNIRDFMGRPMMEWPIRAAKNSRLFDEVIVSTDDVEIATLARFLGCEVHMRLADDGTTGTQEIAARVLEQWQDADEACVIYPCSPLLTARDLQSIERRWRTQAPSQFLRTTLAGADAGCLYWGVAAAFRARQPLVDTVDVELMPDRFIDINTPEDWAQAESMFNALRRDQ